jgi:hypothetical protein
VTKALQKKVTLDQAGESSENLRLKMEGLRGAFRSERVRCLIGREKEIKENIGMSDVAFRELFNETVKQEVERAIIISEIRERKEGTVEEISSSTKIPHKRILKHMIALMKRGAIAIAGEKEDEYLFTALEPVE